MTGEKQNIKKELRASWKVYLVGGAVRDRLLGRPVQERDWAVTGATPDEMKAAGFKQVGNEFPVFIAKDGDEYALARTERKQGTGHTGFICAFGPEITIEEDLKRRDLSINAMALDSNEQLIDPWGGQADLAARRLRHVSEAFIEDPLRVFRVARFAAQLADWKFQVAEETERLLADMSQSGELACLTPERIWRETEKALTAADPNSYFSLLSAWGSLGVILTEAPTNWLDTWGARALDGWLSSTGHPPTPEQVYALLFIGLFTADTSQEAQLKSSLIALKNRMKMPGSYHHLALKVAALLCCGAQPEAAALADAFVRMDLYRNPQWAPAVLAVVHRLAEAAGWRWSCSLIQRCIKAATSVSTDSAIEAGFKGKALGAQIAAKRQAAITSVLTNASAQR